MLDLAEVLNDWLVDCPLTLDEAQRDEMAMWLAERKDTLHHIMKSGKLPEAEEHAAGQGMTKSRRRLTPAMTPSAPARTKARLTARRKKRRPNRAR